LSTLRVASGFGDATRRKEVSLVLEKDVKEVRTYIW
jgi:hypothetical protein